MMQLKVIFTAGAVLTGLLLSNTAFAKPGWDALGNSNGYVSTISCSTCHSGTPNEDNVVTSYGTLFDSLVDDDFLSAASFIALESYDSDGDGFTNGQELRQSGGSVNYATVFPRLTTPDLTVGVASAKEVDGGAVSTLSFTGTAFTGGKTSFEKPATGATTTATFMYTLGGIQTGATATFYDENNVEIPFAPANAGDGSYTVNVIPTTTTAAGSMNILVTDEGVFDLYSTAAFQRIAKARTPTFTPVVSPDTTINSYATISPLAKISPLATVDDYAVIDAYAIVDNYAVIGVYAQVGAYAYVGANVDLYAGTDIYTQVTVDPYVEVLASVTSAPTTKSLPTTTGHVGATFSISTTRPVASIYGSGNTGGGDSDTSESAGGLHCVTAGLGTQSALFILLMGFALLLGRSKQKL